MSILDVRRLISRFADRESLEAIPKKPPHEKRRQEEGAGVIDGRRKSNRICQIVYIFKILYQSYTPGN